MGAFLARRDGACDYSACESGGRVAIGEPITWLRGGKGTFHSACFTAMKAGDSPSVPSPHNGNGHAASPPAVQSVGDASAALAGLASVLAPLVASQVNSVSAELESRIVETVLGVVESQIQQATCTIEVRRYDGSSVAIGDCAHAALAEVLYHASLGDWLYLYGPPGSGKSTLAQQIATALGRSFAYISLTPQSPPSLLIGYNDAQGVYQATEFYRAYVNGGVFCIDEIDNASDALLTVLNSAIANGHGSFPCGMVARHPDFYLCAAGNTPGFGGDWHHPERRALSAALRSRFAFLQVGYDEALESRLVSSINPDCDAWLTWCRDVRAFVAEPSNAVRGVYCDPRSSMGIARTLRTMPVGFLSAESIAERWVRKGAPAEAWSRVVSACPIPTVPS